MTAQDVEVFKIAMRFIKDDLSNMSTVMLSGKHAGKGNDGYASDASGYESGGL